jgi:nicotinamidase/pyrazinamidase
MKGTARTALVVVDMQNAFIAPAGRLAVPGADAVVAAVNARVAAAVRLGWPVFYTRDIGPTELPDGDPEEQTALFAGLDVRGTVVPKGPGKDGGMSGFVLSQGGPGSGGLSELASRLRAAGVDAVRVAGLAADVCVAATARDARRLGYQVSLDLGATAFVHAHPGGDQAALGELVAAGITLTRSRP